MQHCCIACEERYFFTGDEDESQFVCSYCFFDNHMSMGKWTRLRFRILNRDGFQCKYCGKSALSGYDGPLHIDHVVPVSDGGSNSESNLITSCAECNMGKLAFPITKEGMENVNGYLKRVNNPSVAKEWINKGPPHTLTTVILRL